MPGALDDDDRLDRGGALGEPGELARVPDGFQVHDDDGGLRVVVPVLEEVVAGDVGAVAGGDEGGDPRERGRAPVQSGQQRDADGAGLGEQPHLPGGRHLGRQRGVEPDAGGGVDEAEGVGADDAHAVRAGLPDQFALAVAALGATLGVPGGEDDEALHAVLPAVGDDGGHLLGGDRHNGQGDGLLDVAYRAVGGHALRAQPRGARREGPVDRVRTAGEAALQDVAQGGAAHAAGLAAGADDGDRPGGEQPLHGAGLRALLAGALDGEGLVGGLQVEFEADDAVLEGALLGVPGVREDLDHLGVGGQHLGGEPADGALAGDGRDVFQEGGGDAAALVRVLDEEGHLGLVGGGGGGHSARVDAVVADGGDELVPDRGGESDPVDVVVVGEAVDVAVGQARVGGEEAVVLRLVRHLLVEADQALRVGFGDGPDLRRAAVAQHDIGFPVGRVRGVLRRRVHGASVRPGTDRTSARVHRWVGESGEGGPAGARRAREHSG